MSFTPYYSFFETSIISDEGTPNKPEPDECTESASWKVLTSLIPSQLRPASKREVPATEMRYPRAQDNSPGEPSQISTIVHFRLPIAEGTESHSSQSSPAEYVTVPTSPIGASQSSHSGISQDTQTEWPNSAAPTPLPAESGRHDSRGVFEAVLALWPVRRLRSTKPFSSKRRLFSDITENTSLRRIPCPHTDGSSGPISNRPSSEGKPACGTVTPYASFWQRKRLGRARRKIASKMRGLWRIASWEGTQNVSPRKRPFHFHGSWHCSTYSPNVVAEQNPYFLPLFNNISLPSCVLVLLSDIEENWYCTWHPTLVRFWKSARFWIVEIGSYILLTPVLLPWELCAMLAIMLQRVWISGREMSRERVLVRLRDHTEWIARGGVIGILLGACMAFTGGHLRQKR